MPRIYTDQHQVLNYEGDAWGQLQPSGVLRICETVAIMAAADGGYGDEFHAAHGTAWVIRRMTLLLDAPAHTSDLVRITTWASHFVRVRGGREYRLRNLNTDRKVAEGIADWVYVDRKTGSPRPIPPQVGVDMEVPGAPLGTYDPPVVTPLPAPKEYSTTRKAEWYQADSMGHINNTVYADWLDSAFRDVMEEAGWSVAGYKEHGYQLRASYIMLEYKRPTLPGDPLVISTQITGVEGRLCSVRQVIRRAGDDTDLVTADYVYGWMDTNGESCEPPGDWAI